MAMLGPVAPSIRRRFAARAVGRPQSLRKSEEGTAVAEFTMVGALLTILTLAVIQLGIAMHVRGVLHDAAVAGAYEAALVGSSPERGAAYARDLIRGAVGEEYAENIAATIEPGIGGEQIRVTVVAPTPIIALIGLPFTTEVTAHAPRESFD